MRWHSISVFKTRIVHLVVTVVKVSPGANHGPFFVSFSGSDLCQCVWKLDRDCEWTNPRNCASLCYGSIHDSTDAGQGTWKLIRKSLVLCLNPGPVRARARVWKEGFYWNFFLGLTVVSVSPPLNSSFSPRLSVESLQALNSLHSGFRVTVTGWSVPQCRWPGVSQAIRPL